MKSSEQNLSYKNYVFNKKKKPISTNLSNISDDLKNINLILNNQFQEWEKNNPKTIDKLIFKKKFLSNDNNISNSIRRKKVHLSNSEDFLKKNESDLTNKMNNKTSSSTYLTINRKLMDKNESIYSTNANKQNSNNSSKIISPFINVNENTAKTIENKNRYSVYNSGNVIFKDENKKNEFLFRQFGLTLSNTQYSKRNSQFVENFYSTKKLMKKAEMKQEMEKFLKEKYTNINIDYFIKTKETESNDFDEFMKNYKEDKKVKIIKIA